MTGFRIVAPHFVAGGDFSRDEPVCTLAAPIIRYMVGWDWARISAYCFGKGWNMEEQ